MNLATKFLGGRAGSRSVLAILCLVLFLTFLDNTVVSVVLAGVQGDLSAGVQDLQWIVDGYMLVFAALMLTGGTLGDLLGRKKIMLTGVALFSAGSAVSMVAPSVDWLIAGRVVMGVGAAASEPGTLSIIRQVFTERKSRARALGVWAAVSGVALALGPIVGGVLVGFSSWRAVFIFSLALGVLAFIAGILILPESSDRRDRRLDVPGLVLGGVALAAATFGVILGETHGYLDWWIDILLALSIALGAAFVLWEKRSADPVMPIKFFRNPAFSGANIVAFATNFGVFAVFFFTALYLQIIAGFSGYAIAADFVAMAILMVVAALATGRWNATHGPLAPTVLGCWLAGGGMFLVDAVLSPNVNDWALAGALALVGLGFGMTLTTMTTLVLNIVPPERSGMAASTVNTFREMGGIFSVAILGAVVNGQLTADLTARLSALGLPANFQSLAIYAVTHGGNTPANAHVSAGAILQHPELVGQVTNAAYAAFGHGLDIALYIAGVILLITGFAAWGSLRHYKWYVPARRRAAVS